MILKCKYVFISQHIDNLHICFKYIYFTAFTAIIIKEKEL